MTRKPNITELNGWKQMKKDMRRAMHCDDAEPDFDEMCEGIAAGNTQIEIGSFFTVSKQPELIDIPQDIIDWIKQI